MDAAGTAIVLASARANLLKLDSPDLEPAELQALVQAAGHGGLLYQIFN